MKDAESMAREEIDDYVKKRRANTRKDDRAGSCQFCSNYVYDEEADCYVCMVQLDEDEMEGFLRYTVRDCHYFQLDDEYKIVRKQN